MTLIPMNNLEKKVLEMMKEGKHLNGFAREILMEMTLRQMEKGKEEDK